MTSANPTSLRSSLELKKAATGGQGKDSGVISENQRLITVSPNESARKLRKQTNYEGWNFNFGNNPLDWIQELLE